MRGDIPSIEVTKLPVCSLALPILTLQLHRELVLADHPPALATQRPEVVSLVLLLFLNRTDLLPLPLLLVLFHLLKRVSLQVGRQRVAQQRRKPVGRW